MSHNNASLTKHAVTVGLFVVVLYVLCLLWRVTMTDPEVIRFHLLSLKTALPGFQGFDALSIVWGGVISFVYGFLGSVIFHKLHSGCCGMKD
mgnify:CR=1 FL=1